MKAILQRVLRASVSVDGQLVSSIQRGVLVFAAMAPGDTEREADLLAGKVLRMKMWDDEEGKRWKKNVQEINGEILCVSQFTLLANTKKGSRPDFHGALSPDQARRLYEYFLGRVRALFAQEQKDAGATEKVKDGVFQAMMEVELVNDGPVTLELNVEPAPAKVKSSKGEPVRKVRNESQEASGSSITEGGPSNI